MNASTSQRKLGKFLDRLLNSVLVQESYTVAGSPLPETRFSPEGAAGIPEVSLFEFLFSYPQVNREWWGVVGKMQGEGGGQGRASLGEEAQGANIAEELWEGKE